MMLINRLAISARQRYERVPRRSIGTELNAVVGALVTITDFLLPEVERDLRLAPQVHMQNRMLRSGVAARSIQHEVISTAMGLVGVGDLRAAIAADDKLPITSQAR